MCLWPLCVVFKKGMCVCTFSLPLFAFHRTLFYVLPRPCPHHPCPYQHLLQYFLYPCTDVTVGTWMASFNVTYFDDRRLCQAECDGSSLVIHETKMCTSCDPRRFLEKHKNSRACQSMVHGTLCAVRVSMHAQEYALMQTINTTYIYIHTYIFCTICNPFPPTCMFIYMHAQTHTHHVHQPMQACPIVRSTDGSLWCNPNTPLCAWGKMDTSSRRMMGSQSRHH